jgi:hypothetical protein
MQVHSGPKGRQSIARGVSPWLSAVIESQAPTGRQYDGQRTAALLGLTDDNAPHTRGLRTWLLTAAALRLKCMQLHKLGWPGLAQGRRVAAPIPSRRINPFLTGEPAEGNSLADFIRARRDT